MECEKKINKIKSRLTKIHDKIQSKVDYFCDDLHDVVHHGFKNHVKNSSTVCLYQKIYKNKLNIDLQKRSSSMECLKTPDLSEGCEYKINYSPNELSKINFITAAPLSKSAQSLLESDNYHKNDIPIIITDNSMEVTNSDEFIEKYSIVSNLSHSSTRFVFTSTAK